MGNDSFLKLCKLLVKDYYNDIVEKTADFKITEDNIYIVWSCKTLQNNKALVSTSVSDGMYYEITYNGDKDEVYFDAYKRWENKAKKVTEFLKEKGIDLDD